MSKILRFPGAEEPKKAPVWKRLAARVSKKLFRRPTREGMTAFVGKLAIAGWSVTVSGLFLLMYWMRWLVVGLAKVTSMVTLVAFLFTWYTMPEAKDMLWTFGLVSFVSFVLMYGYDTVLHALAPQEFMREL
ncbi:hypothetical protein [Achromobacter spanius]|uniref:hypothetical protein n=1 Tax=Achromobacter spanius TaxID=217203 RepID=UPI0037FD71D6